LWSKGKLTPEWRPTKSKLTVYYTAISRIKGDSILCTSLVEASNFTQIPLGVLRYHLGKKGRHHVIVTSPPSEVWVHEEIIRQVRPQYGEDNFR